MPIDHRIIEEVDLQEKINLEMIEKLFILLPLQLQNFYKFFFSYINLIDIN